MQEIYYDSLTKSRIDPGKDILSWDQWKNGDSGKCCRHPDNFLIFVKNQFLEINDEYAEGDPYSVTKNIKGSFHQRRFKNTLHLLKKYAGHKGGLKILDLACGEGHLTNEVKSTFPNHDVYGFDYSVSAIQFAHTHYPAIEFSVADAYDAPYEDDYFDVVILNNIWEHVPDPIRLLREAQRILKKGGGLVVSTPSRYRFSNLLRVLQGKQITFMSKLHVTEYTIGQIKEQLYYANFEVSQVYSESIREQRVPVHLLKMVLGFVLRVIKSHHVLESTVFYLAVKK